MARTKLTLTVKPEVVRMAKSYAQKHGTSVSDTFSRVMRALVAAEKNRTLNVPADSSLETLTAILKLPEGMTADGLRFKALVEKYGLEEEPGVTE
jgi:hypothetical protein